MHEYLTCNEYCHGVFCKHSAGYTILIYVVKNVKVISKFSKLRNKYNPLTPSVEYSLHLIKNLILK